jgi:hypothetical protein
LTLGDILALLAIVAVADAPNSSRASPTASSALTGSTHGRGRRWFLGLALATAALGFSMAVPAGSASGTIRAAGRPYGDFSLEVTECYSWNEVWTPDVWVITELVRPAEGHVGFRGGVLVHEDEGGGFGLVVESPQGCEGFRCPQRELDPQRCRIFDVTSRANGWW